MGLAWRFLVEQQMDHLNVWEGVIGWVDLVDEVIRPSTAWARRKRTGAFTKWLVMAVSYEQPPAFPTGQGQEVPTSYSIFQNYNMLSRKV